MDVITLGQDRCYVATSAKVQYPSFFVNRYKHRGEELGYVHDMCVYELGRGVGWVEGNDT